MTALLFILSWIGQAWAGQIRIHISGVPDCAPEVSIRWMNQDKSLQMEKVGQVWVGAENGPTTRYLPIHVQIPPPCPGATDEFLHNYRLKRETDDIYIAFDREEPRAQLLSNVGSRSRIQRKEGISMALYGLWTAIALIGIRFLIRSTSHQKLNQPRIWTELCIWIGFAFLWNGSILFDAGLPGRHQDAVGTHWLLSMAPSWNGFLDSSSGWPFGADYSRLDSFIWFGIAKALNGFNAIFVYKFFLVAGPALSALAASRCIRAWGAVGYTPLIAGFVYAFSGLAGNAALEGQAHMLFQPWLPLCLWFFVQSCQSKHPILPGATAGLCFGLCLLTSAYVGVGCFACIVAYWIGSGAWRKLQSLSIALTAIPIGLGYAFFYFSSTLSKTSIETAQAIGSLTMARIWGSTPELDRGMHGLTLGLLFIPLAALIYSGIKKDMKVWLWPLATALILAMGPYFSIDSNTPLFPLPMLALQSTPGLDALNFPIRLAWPALLIIGWLSAMAVSQLHQSGRISRVIVILIAVECLAVNGLSQRQGRHLIANADDWKELTGPIYTLLPISPEKTKLIDLDLEYSMLACTLQTQHKQAIAENCVGTNLETSPRVGLGRWMLPLLMTNEADAIKRGMEERGFATIVWAPDLFHAGDRSRIEKTLEQIDSHPHSFSDAGVALQTYRLSPTSPNLVNIPDKVIGKKWGSPTDATKGSLRIITNAIEEAPRLTAIFPDEELPIALNRKHPEDVYISNSLIFENSSFTLKANWPNKEWIGDISTTSTNDWVYLDHTGLWSWPAWSTSPAATEERWPATLCAILFSILSLLFVIRFRK